DGEGDGRPRRRATPDDGGARRGAPTSAQARKPVISKDQVAAIAQKYGFKEARQLTSGLAGIASDWWGAKTLEQVQDVEQIEQARRRLELALRAVESVFENNCTAAYFLRLRVRKSGVDLFQWRFALRTIRDACREPLRNEPSHGSEHT